MVSKTTSDISSAAEKLLPGPRALPQDNGSPRLQAPPFAIAVMMARQEMDSHSTWVHLASSERRAEEVGRALSGIIPETEVLILPPWDCLPFDRASPGRDVMGRRMAVLRRLASDAKPRFLIVSPESFIQRLAPSDAAKTVFTVECGATLDREALANFAHNTGYVPDDRVDEPGEIALLGEVVDVFPPNADNPIRITFDSDHVVTALRTYDPLTQRTIADVASTILGPASELVVSGETQTPRAPGIEHRLADHYQSLVTLFDILPKATASKDDFFEDKLNDTLEQLDEAYRAHKSISVSPEDQAPSLGLYLNREGVTLGLQRWMHHTLDLSRIASAPSVVATLNPGAAFCEAVAHEQAAGRRVVLTGLAHEIRVLDRAIARGLGQSPEPLSSWRDVETVSEGSLASFTIDVDTGFVDKARALTVITASDVLGGRLARASRSSPDVLTADQDLRPGDVVLHEDHGVGVFRELTTVDVEGVPHDTLRLEYRGGVSLLVPMEDIGRIWRYGAGEEAVTLDRLKGDGWGKRRATVSQHLDSVAQNLLNLAKIRSEAECDPISPPTSNYRRFVSRFGYAETPDQGAAIAAVLADLASGSPMDRLVCGDVGYGKTEVALRAAAAVALSGHQVAVCAPTTVLAKQHYQTFKRRFADTGIEVVHLSRLVTSREAATARAAMADGRAGISVGTHALGGAQVDFADLQLMVIDEEQKFGAQIKKRLRELARGAHVLTTTATPIPRTLLAAMVGVQDVSVIATPPARRRPIRTFLAPFDGASVRTALMRENRRNGQSFIVAPRIEDIGPLEAQLKTLTPELSVKIAHGELPASDVDNVMVGFADGDGDILLATNIIESGLDVPRANTMIIWRPDRFGLSQLHQLRGRVGRGRAQGVAYLLHDPSEPLSDATRARLSTLEAFDRLGSGLSISARDLDLRGAGDLTGDDQAGHMQMVGAALYNKLLQRALKVARGETVADDVAPSIQLGQKGGIPHDHVPDAVTRINLYARLARLVSVQEIDAFEEELIDRFGPLPPTLEQLLIDSRLSCLARAAGVREVVVGPKATAILLTTDDQTAKLSKGWKLPSGSEIKEGRLIIPVVSGDDDAARIAIVESVLTRLANV